jgi:hypothetical protein
MRHLLWIARSGKDVQAALLESFDERRANTTSTAARDKNRFESHEGDTNDH